MVPELPGGLVIVVCDGGEPVCSGESDRMELQTSPGHVAVLMIVLCVGICTS